MDLEIPIQYSRGEKFLQYDSGPGEDRVIIFATQEALDVLKGARNVFSDGTFKTCPNLFTQIYTIHADLRGKVVPMVYALLANKRHGTYLKLLTAVKSLLPNWALATVTTDFEAAAVRAWKDVYPTARQHGCYFHFSQCLWREIQRHPAILQRYNSDDIFCGQVKLLPALALVPPADVTMAYEALAETQFYRDTQILYPFLDYFERNWVGSWNRWNQSRGDPLFPIAVWNCYQSVLEEWHLTTNALEGWHRQFAARVGGTHPSIWPLIQEFKSEEVAQSIKINEYIRGRAAPPRRAQYEQRATEIHTAVGDYGTLTPVLYLQGMSGNIALNV